MNVPRPPIALKSEIQPPACSADMPCDRWKNALLNAPEAYHTTECSAAARLRCTNDGRRNMNDSTSDTGGAFFFSTTCPPKSA